MNSIIAEIPTKYNGNGKAKATYNHSQRQWIVANGDQILDILPPKHKEAAQLSALHHNNPALAVEVEAIIENNRFHPEAQGIERRAIKAGLMIQGGNVLAPRAWRDGRYHASEVAAVQSQYQVGIAYSIYFNGIGDEPGYLACECEDHQNGLMRAYYPIGHPERPRYGAPTLFNQQIACKHILAILISEILGA